MRLAALLVAVALVVAGCGTDEAGDAGDGAAPDATSTTSTASGAPTIEVGVGSLVTTLEVEPYPPESGEAVAWIATITNRSTRGTETLTFRSGLQVDVALLAGGDEVYRWSDDQAFTQAIVEEELGPGETLEVRLDEERLDVDPGEYTFVFEPKFERARELEVQGGGTVEVVEGA